MTTNRLPDDEVRRLLALAEAAGSGPWTADKARPDGFVMEQDVVRASVRINASTDVIAICNRDAIFIAASREAIPALCREVLAQREEIVRLREKLEAIESLADNSRFDPDNACGVIAQTARAALSPATQ